MSFKWQGFKSVGSGSVIISSQWLMDFSLHGFAVTFRLEMTLNSFCFVLKKKKRMTFSRRITHFKYQADRALYLDGSSNIVAAAAKPVRAG